MEEVTLKSQNYERNFLFQKKWENTSIIREIQE